MTQLAHIIFLTRDDRAEVLAATWRQSKPCTALALHAKQMLQTADARLTKQRPAEKSWALQAATSWPWR